jgi:hypothetical protein
VGALAAGFFSLLLFSSLRPEYGHYGDEFNYIGCAKRPALGYVDHPPLAPLILAINRSLLGDSLPALRILPALCGAVTVLLAAAMATMLGGRAFARFLAALCVVAAPLYLVMFSIFSTNGFEIALWAFAFYVLLRLGESAEPRSWWWLGGLVGIAVMTKHTSVLLLPAIAAGVLLSPLRAHLASRHFWIGAGIAVLVMLPNLYWQVRHDWASLDFYVTNDRVHNFPTSVLGALDGQLSSFNPGAAPVWIAGLFLLLLSRRGKPYRMVGWTAALLYAALLLSGKSRTDRIQGIYPVLFAAGAVQLESVFTRRRFAWLRYALPSLILVAATVATPLMLPILRPETAARYLRAIDDDPHPVQREIGTSRLLLPLAHRSGWDELVHGVSTIYAGLDAAERKTAIILAEYVAVSEAVELLGGAALPRAYSPSLTGYFWGVAQGEPGVVITLGYEPEQLASVFDRIDVVARMPCEYCMGWRQNYPIALARGPRRPLAAAWPELRTFFGRKQYLLDKADLG